MLLGASEGGKRPLSVAANANGKAHVLYTGRDNQIHYRRWTGEDWKPDELLPAPGPQNYHPHIASGVKGAPHAVFVSQLGADSSSYVVVYTTRKAHVWLPPVELSGEAGAQLPHIAIGPDNVLHVIYNTFAAASPQIYYTHSSSSGWTKPQAIGLGFYPELTVDIQGAVHVAWNGDVGILYSRRDPSGAWSSPSLIASGKKQQTPVLAPDSAGNVHLAWQSRDKTNLTLTYARIAPDGQLNITNRVQGGDFRLIYWPRIAADCNNRARLVYQAKLTNTGQEPWAVYERVFDGLRWSEPRRLDDPPNNDSNQVPDVHAAGATLVTAWWDRTAFEVYGAVTTLDCPPEPGVPTPTPEPDEDAKAGPDATTKRSTAPSRTKRTPVSRAKRSPARSRPARASRSKPAARRKRASGSG